MREILFRGKDLNTGRWKYGDYARVQNPFSEDGLPLKHLICEGTNVFNQEVITETVGQYTGLTDKNGKKIFEGDIIRIPGSNKKGLPASVRFNPICSAFEIQRIGYSAIGLDGVKYWGEVVGNIHDNPELLEGSE